MTAYFSMLMINITVFYLCFIFRNRKTPWSDNPNQVLVQEQGLHPTTRTVREIKMAREILKNGSLRSRALPNQRLVVVFKIENATTTSNTAYHQQFITSARQLLSTTDEKWFEIAQDSLLNVKQFLRKSSRSTNLVSMIEVVVFRSVFKKLFPAAISTASNEDLAPIPMALNKLWVLSKDSSKHHTKEHMDDWIQLQKALNAIFGRPADYPIEGKTSELNLLLPAYETLWRVVFRCFLEIRFRASSTESKEWRKLFQEFLSNPSKSNLEVKFNAQRSVSVDFIVRETLRLYPPTRRIHRKNEVEDVTESIDVEFLHRDAKVWGKDRLEFNPARWSRIDAGKSARSYIPFGGGKYGCPARSVFGPMMIGILVAALDSAIDDEYVLKAEKTEDSLGVSGPLKGGREVYNTLYLAKLE